MLPRDGRVAMMATPGVEAMEGATKPLHGGLALDDPVALPRASPVVGKAEEVKRPRPAGGLSPLSLWGVGRASKTDHPCLGGVQGEPIFGEPLWEDRHEALRIAFPGAEDHQVVGKAVESCFPIEPWHGHLLEPRIEDGMQKDIRQERRHLSPYKVANFFFGIVITWIWGDPKHDLNFVTRDFSPRDQCSDGIALART